MRQWAFLSSRRLFADLYAYSDHKADMGNCRSYADFFTHFRFLVEQLQRTMMPGRIVAVHCMDVPLSKGKDGEMGFRDFSGDIIRLFSECGFVFASRHCIWKDPLIAATRTHALGLAHQQIVKDSTRCRTGAPDYIVAFRKRGENPKPVKHPMGLTEYCGERSIPSHLSRYESWEDPKTNKRSHWIWQQYASPVWDDIRQTRTLKYREAKEKDDQRHICPLQLDVIERCLTLWSAKGDTVLSPFAGVGSEIYVAVKMKRKAIGIELKDSYFRQMVRNLAALERKQQIRKNRFL